MRTVRLQRPPSGSLLGAANAAGMLITLGLTVPDALELEDGHPDDDQQSDEG